MSNIAKDVWDPGHHRTKENFHKSVDMARKFIYLLEKYLHRRYRGVSPDFMRWQWQVRYYTYKRAGIEWDGDAKRWAMPSQLICSGKTSDGSGTTT